MTDSVSRVVTYDPDLRPGLSNLIDLHMTLTGKSSEEIVSFAQNQNLNKKTYKEYLASVVNEQIQPINSEMQRLLSDRGHLSAVLKVGQEKASSIAEKTMKEVKHLVGFS